MAIKSTAEQLLALIDSDRILALEQSLIRIPSSHFQEQAIADYLADYMSELGLDDDGPPSIRFLDSRFAPAHW